MARPTGENTKKFLFGITPDLHQALKQNAVDQNRTMGAIAREAIGAYLAYYADCIRKRKNK